MPVVLRYKGFRFFFHSNEGDPLELLSDALAKQVRFDEDTMWVDLVDGRTLGVPLAYFPRLLNASPAERMKYVVSGGGTGLHWDDLDEDISVPALLLGVGDRTRKSV
jgi:hypothetical protein